MDSEKVGIFAVLLRWFDFRYHNTSGSRFNKNGGVFWILSFFRILFQPWKFKSINDISGRFGCSFDSSNMTIKEITERRVERVGDQGYEKVDPRRKSEITIFVTFSPILSNQVVSAILSFC